MQDDLPLNFGQNSVVSEVSLHATKNENFESPVKTRSQIEATRLQSKNLKPNSKLKWRKSMNLKLEHDKLEYEISQGQKIQGNIDKLCVKIPDLKKHKDCDCGKTKPKSKLKHELSKT